MLWAVFNLEIYQGRKSRRNSQEYQWAMLPKKLVGGKKTFVFFLFKISHIYPGLLLKGGLSWTPQIRKCSRHRQKRLRSGVLSNHTNEKVLILSFILFLFLS